MHVSIGKATSTLFPSTGQNVDAMLATCKQDRCAEVSGQREAAFKLGYAISLETAHGAIWERATPASSLIAFPRRPKDTFDAPIWHEP